MLSEALNVSLYGAIFLSLFLIDYALGNGFVDMFQKVFCKIACFIKKSVREETSNADMAVIQNPISLPILFLEILLLTLTIAILKKYKQIRGRDRIDELLQESKEALQQTNEFLEKWRLRRINWQVPTEYNYLDDEPQEIKPLKLEVPILHMAIIDTRGTSRNQLERGDAGDINFPDSTLLSVTSLVDDDIDSIPDPLCEDKILEETKNTDFRGRYLWDVMEEDSTED